MAIKIYYDSSAGDPTPILVNGPEPVDQSALVAQLQAQVAALTTERDALKTFRDLAVADAQTRKAADAASVDGQNIIDAAP